MASKFDTLLDHIRDRDLAFRLVTSVPPSGLDGDAIIDTTTGNVYVHFGTWQLVFTLTLPANSAWYGGLLLDLPTGQE